jgi:hypothetical protein
MLVACYNTDTNMLLTRYIMNALGSYDDQKLISHSVETIDRAMKLLGYGYTNTQAMNKLNEWTTLDEATNRRSAITLYDMQLLIKRFKRSSSTTEQRSRLLIKC